MWNDLHSFYTSREWNDLLLNLKMSRVNDDGELICAHCGKPITRMYDCIGHHIKNLTVDNVNDISISLNPKNIILVHHKCHNEIHCRFGAYSRHVYIVYGSPLSGKTTYVNSVCNKDDMVVDMDRIRECISGGKLYESNRLNDNVFAVRDLLLDMIKTKRGNWINAYVIGGYPYRSERERLAKDLGAELVYIESTQHECLERLKNKGDGRNIANWTKYIQNWWNTYTPGG